MWSGASAAATTVAEPVVGGRHLEFARDGAMAGSVLAVSPGEAGSSGSRAHGAASADVIAVAMSAGRVRHSGIAKHSVRESEIAVPSGEAGLSWSRASGSANTAEMAADAKSGCSSAWHDLACWRGPRSHAGKTSRESTSGCVKRS